MHPQHVLILGASGFLGPHLVRAATARGLRVTAAARRPEFAAHFVGDRPPGLVACDVEAVGSAAALLERLGPTGVISVAALARVSACEDEPARAARLNSELPEELARACRERDLRLVHLSTDLVFGARPPRRDRYTEEDPPAPLHAYGRTKAEGEVRLLKSNPAALVVRLPLLYGDSGDRGLGATDQVAAALARGERPTLFRDEWRTPLEASNAAHAVLELFASRAAGLWHLAGPERLSRLELGLVWLASQGVEGPEAWARLRPASRSEFDSGGARPADVSLASTRGDVRLATRLLAPREALPASPP